MSEAFSAYLLRASDRRFGIELLSRAQVDGLVLSPSNGWVPFLADSPMFVADVRVIMANRSPLLYIWGSEAGWGFRLFHGSIEASAYEFSTQFGERRLSEAIDWRHLLDSLGCPAADAALIDATKNILFQPQPPGVSPSGIAAKFLRLINAPDVSGLPSIFGRGHASESSIPVVEAVRVIKGVPHVAPSETFETDERSSEPDDAQQSVSYDPRLLGTWVIIRTTNWRGLREIPYSDQITTFEKDRIIVTNFGDRAGQFISSYTVRTDRRPAEIDEFNPEFDFETSGTKWIYRVDDDELTVCWGFARDPRPAEFTASREPRYRLDVYRRQKS
jgi:uncharacterized protein (TIGR03067 family)